MRSERLSYMSDVGGCRKVDGSKGRAHNHLEFHWHVSNKKALFYHMKAYY
jgi:hypothetical protein